MEKDLPEGSRAGVLSQPIVVGAMLATGAALGAALPLGLAWGFLHPPRRLHQHNPQSALGLPFERIRFRSADGTKLHGWFVPAADPHRPRGLVIISHGYWGNRAEMLPYLRFIHAAGYAAVLYDFRAHGWSGGKRITFGIREPDDLRAAIDWVMLRDDLCSLPLILLGESMGAAVSLLVAAEEPRVRAVVADSAYARFDGAVVGRLKTLLGDRAGGTLAPPAQRAGERILGVRCVDIAPEDVVNRIAPRPIFLIHGLEDKFIIPENSRRLLAACSGNARLWEIPGARHVRSIYVAGEEYGRKVMDFLEEALE